MNEAAGPWGLLAQGIQDTLNIGLGYEQRIHNESREDTAVRRRVRDLRAAGINPILAAGQAATSQPTPIPEAKGAPSLGEMLQLRAAKHDIAQTQAQTDLINANADKTRAEKRGVDILNEHNEKMNPMLQTQQAEQNKFNEQMNPIRFIEEQRKSTGVALQNEKTRNENELVKVNVDIRKLEKETEEIKTEITRKYGMSNAEADAYIKKAAVWISDSERLRMEYMNNYVIGTGSSFTSPDGSGIVGQVKQFVNTLLNPGRTPWAGNRENERSYR